MGLRIGGSRTEPLTVRQLCPLPPGSTRMVPRGRAVPGWLCSTGTQLFSGVPVSSTALRLLRVPARVSVLILECGWVWSCLLGLLFCTWVGSPLFKNILNNSREARCEKNPILAQEKNYCKLRRKKKKKELG